MFYSYGGLKLKIVAVLFFVTPPLCQKKFLRFDPTLGSNNSGSKNYRIKNHHIFGIARTSAFIWHMWIPLKNFCNATRRVCVCIFLVHYGPFPQEVNENSVKLAVWHFWWKFCIETTWISSGTNILAILPPLFAFWGNFYFFTKFAAVPNLFLALRRIMIYNQIDIIRNVFKSFKDGKSAVFCWPSPPNLPQSDVL